jgi:acetolactate decarboxylase
MKTTFLIVVCAWMISFESACQSRISVYGQLRQIMQRGDLAAHVSLDTLKLNPSAFGLGVAAGLKGEIIIIGGKPHVTCIEDGKLVNKQTNQLKAAMLVTANADVEPGKIMVSDAQLTQLEESLKNLSATTHRTEPIPFLIDTDKADVTYHVIDWKEQIEHTAENHKQFAQSGNLHNERVIIVGFYSQNHIGIFTPHTSRIHLHVYSPSTGLVGHVDAIKLTGKHEILTF